MEKEAEVACQVKVADEEWEEEAVEEATKRGVKINSQNKSIFGLRFDLRLRQL